jgi:hypothetical protein
MVIYTPHLIYYIYAYLRADGTPYYIGKGKDKRAWSKDHSVSLPNDNTRIVIIEANLTEIGAFALERRMIRWYGRKDIGTGILRNGTDGGDGVSGVIQSTETKRKRSEALKGHIHSKESKLKMSEANKGRVHSEETKRKRIESISKIYTFIDPDGNKITIKNLAKFCRENNLTASSMFRVSKGENSHHKGWKVFMSTT